MILIMLCIHHNRSIGFISVDDDSANSQQNIRHKISHVQSKRSEISNNTAWESTPLSGSDDLWSLRNVSRPVTNVVVARELKLPRERPGFFTSKGLGTARIHYYESIEDGDQPSLRYKRQRTLGGVVQPWEPDYSEYKSRWLATEPVRRNLLQQGLTARKGGTIGTHGRGVVALRFDDAPVEFVAKVLPLLRARSLPFTRVSTTQSISGTPIDPEIFAEMQAYCLASGGELWAHGTNHVDASGESAITAEIVDALTDLRIKCPRLPIDCFAPPGGSGMSYDGHMPSTSVEAWSSTFAGRLIMGHYALAGGYFENTYYRPLDGILRDGQIHYSTDTYNFTRAKELIDRARDWKVGVVMMWHSNKLDRQGCMSLADFEALLDYVVAHRNAEDILVLTVSGLALADVSTSHRDNVLVRSAGDPFEETILYPQFRQNLPGSTRELTAIVSGKAGATVTSTICDSAMAHSIPLGGTLNLRHVATIPTDATSFTVSIDSNTTNAKLLAV